MLRKMTKMRKHYLLFVYCVCGFLFVTLYLSAAILSKSESQDGNNRVSKALKRQPNAPVTEDGTGLTEAETRRLMREAEARNNRRIQRAENMCGKYNLGLYKTSENKTLEHPPVPQYGVFYFDRPNKLSLCPIYKAGSSTWLFNLLLLSGMTEEEIDGSGKQLSVMVRERYPQLEPEDAEQALQKTIKVLTVRHPFERLLSAYRDKLENINVGREHGTLHFYKSFGSKIVRKYREGGNDTKTWQLLKPSQYLWNPNADKPAGIEPTFREFVLYLINTNLVTYADDHWIPYYLFCTPCLLRYDIIAKVETMDSDQLYAIHVLGLQGKIKPRWRHKTQFVQGESSDVVSHLAKVYFSQLSKEEVNKLYEKYKVDFDLFGYEHSEYLKYARDSNR